MRVIPCGKTDLDLGKASGGGKDKQEVCAAEHNGLAMKGSDKWKAHGWCGVRRVLINLYSIAL